MKRKNIFPFILSILIAQSAGIIGSFFTVSSVDSWYTTLVKPELNPPSWVFGPVWITLYTFMGIAAYLIWTKRRKLFKKKKVREALNFYGIQLVLNALWSILFFGLKSPKLAFLEIIVLLIFIFLTTMKFWKLDKRAGGLFIPYLLWVAFAAYLNYNIWQLNI